MLTAIAEKPWIVQIVILLVIFVFRAALFAGGSSLWIYLSKKAKSKTVVRNDKNIKLWYDIRIGLGILLFDAVLVITALKLGILRGANEPTWVISSLTFISLFIWFEIYFYYSHRIMHLPKFYPIHKCHHYRRATNPWTSLTFSLPERLIINIGAILVPGLISQFLPLSLNGLALYFLTNYILNVYGHLNVEIIPHKFLSTTLGKAFNNTTYHALHHARYRGHYGLFTSVLDRWHKTYFTDYEKIHLAASTQEVSAPVHGVV